MNAAPKAFAGLLGPWVCAGGLFSFGAQLSYGLAGAPHLAFAQGGEFGFKLFAIAGLGVAIDGALCFFAGRHTPVEALHDGLDGVVERGHPVERAALGGGGAVGIHPVHAAGGEEGHEALGELFDGLVEGLGGGVAVLAEHFVLGEEEALHGAHEGAALAGEVAHCLAPEGGLEEVAGADADAQGEGFFEGAAAGVLMDGIGGVEAAAFKVHGAQGGAAALGGYHHHVNVGGGLYAGAVAPGDGEAVGEIERFAGGEVGLDGGPELHLGSVGEEHADDGGAAGGLFNGEERFSGLPAVCHGFVVRFSGALAHDDIEAAVAQVAGLAGALYAVA